MLGPKSVTDPDRAPRTGPAMIVPLIVACALFMQNLDSTVISTALPQIGASIGADPVRLSLAVTTYLLSLAVFIPISGWVADRYGARRVFRTAIVVFTLGSVLCGFSSSLLELTASRVIQGIGGAMMVPVGRLLVLRSVPKAELVRAMAWISIPAMLGPVMGPPIGGFIATYATWHWIFFLNVPIGVLGVILVSMFIPDRKELERTPFDLLGFLLSGIGLATLLFGLETLGRDGIPVSVPIALIVTGTVAIVLYCAHAARHPKPAVDIQLFRIPTFAVAVGGGSLFRVGIGALPFLLPLMFQLGFGMTALGSGLLTFASAVGALAMKATAGPILRRLGFRRVMMWDALVSAGFLFSYALFRPDTPLSVIFALLLVGGFFRSLQFTAINTLAFADIPSERMSRATSLSSTAQQLSMSVGVAIGAGLLHLTLVVKGTSTLDARDFWPAFAAVGLLTGSSVLTFLTLRRDAGAEMSGHRASAAAPGKP